MAMQKAQQSVEIYKTLIIFNFKLNFMVSCFWEMCAVTKLKY